jgi:poly(A) polymerase
VHLHVLKRSQHPISRRQIDVIALKVLYRLIDAGFVAYLVGGAVRDLMLGRTPKDFDVGTTAHPNEVRALFRNSRLIGRRFPLVHVFFAGGRIVEVATFRANPDSSTSSDGTGRYLDNSFGTPEQDAFRRDFTINALFYDPKTYCVLDYVSGLTDLRQGLVRTVGDAELRMREDPVRMVRAVRLAAKLNFALEPSLRAAIEACHPLILEASAPRLVEELHRMLAADGSSRALQLMRELGLLKVLLPGLYNCLEQSTGAWERATQNLRALEEARRSGTALPRSVTLAGLFADLGMCDANNARALVSLAAELRQRGFSRAETSQARLLLNALRRFRTRRRIARLTRQPYCGEAQILYQLVAPTYGLEPKMPSGFDNSDNSDVRALSNGTRKERRARRRRRRIRGLRAPHSAHSSDAHAMPSSDQPGALRPSISAFLMASRS